MAGGEERAEGVRKIIGVLSNVKIQLLNAEVNLLQPGLLLLLLPGLILGLQLLLLLSAVLYLLPPLSL
jgi:hypothetical protein